MARILSIRIISDIGRPDIYQVMSGLTNIVSRHRTRKLAQKKLRMLQGRR